MCSVTADPPTLLVCIKSTSVIVDAIREHRVFGVNLLRADQRRVADSFAGRSTSGVPYDFDSARWDTLSTGVPMLVGAVGRFDCRLTTVLDVGSHSVMFGEVQQADSASGTPLLYARRSYGEHVEIPRISGELPFDLDVRLVDEDLFHGEPE
jgi:flavin reductase